MFFSKSTMFAVYAKRALVIMVSRLGAALEMLLDIRYQIGLCLACNLFALFILSLFHSQLDSADQTRVSDKAETLEHEQKEDSVKGETTSANVGPQIPIIQDACPADQNQDTTQARPRHIQAKVSVNSHLKNHSNRSLQDSIWATPKPFEDKTPTQKTHSQLVSLLPSSDSNDFCSNQAERRTKEPTLQEKIQAFERKSMGISPWFDGAFQLANNGHTRLRRHRSFPRLRNSVLAWWAGVQEQDSFGELPKEPDVASDFEEHSDCSVCEVIRPGDSWSAAMHNPRIVNDEDRTPTKTTKIFTNFNPAILPPDRRVIN
ncbi:hypothetical protein APHAL10511_000981 [Amanita phalloides]|nr:hypothetical protein APHAL10511_000981 [Amanita phalloides]